MIRIVMIFALLGISLYACTARDPLPPKCIEARDQVAILQGMGAVVCPTGVNTK